MANMYADSLRAFLKPILKFLDDESVSEIMINGPEDIWIERKGQVTRTDVKFTEEGLLGAARNMAQFVGRVLNEERPRLDARLPDGSRIHVVLPPIARKGTTISIRKFFKDKLTIDKLVDFGSMTPPMARFIEGCVRIKENIIVAGGTGSGKTTLLNIVSSLIPDDERILTIEDSAELQLNQEHLVPFESRPADKFGKGEVNMGHLLHSALRLRPDRIVVGEVRGGEAFDLMQAMNTGHGGSMATTHANTPTDTLRRIESLCLMSGIELPMVAVRAQVASAINVIITCERLQDGSRKTTAVAEVLPLNEKGDYRSQDIFTFVPTHKDGDGKIHGYHAPTGAIPHFLGRLHAYGFTDMVESFFDPATYGVPPPPNFNPDTSGSKWIKRFKYRERGERETEEQEAQWAQDRLDYGKQVEAKAKEAAAKKAAAAPAPAPAPAATAPAPAAAAPAHKAEPHAPSPAAAPPKAEAPRPRPQLPPPEPARPAEPRPAATENAAAERLFEGVDTSSQTGAKPLQPPVSSGRAPTPPPRPAPTVNKTGSVQVAADLLADGEVEHQEPSSPTLYEEPEDTPPPYDGEDEGEETLAPRGPSAVRRPGPAAPRPSAVPVRAPGPRRPAPSRGFGQPGGEEEDPGAAKSDKTMIKNVDPRRR